MIKINNIIDLNDHNTIYQSNNCGGFRVLEDLGRDSTRGSKKIKVQFVESGGIKDVYLDHAMEGTIRDDLNGIDFNKIYYSKKHGPFKILNMEPNLNGCRMAKIKFINTGSEKIARVDHILNGAVADPSIPPVIGVGWYGDVECKHDECRKEYSVWIGILTRCYKESSNEFDSYGGAGVTVCERWLTFSNFLNDVKSILNYDKMKMNQNKWQLDKDYIQSVRFKIPKHMQVYSPETCIWIPHASNVKLSLLQRGTAKSLVIDLGCGLYDALINYNGYIYSIGIYDNCETAAHALNLYISNSYINCTYPQIPLNNLYGKKIEMVKIVDK